MRKINLVGKYFIAYFSDTMSSSDSSESCQSDDEDFIPTNFIQKNAEKLPPRKTHGIFVRRVIPLVQLCV